MNITFEDLIKKINDYNPEEVEIITKAYKIAKSFHAGQLRESGEAYIVHPLNVAYILAEMKADRDTVCAGLLHDTIEDTNLTKEDIAREFNPSVATLVDGVTKLAKMDFISKESLKYANTRKIVSGITTDVRIIIIKLADRLHNMRTLQYKSVNKQRENAMETMEIFVPLANYIGAYNIKTELEDLSLKYLYPDSFVRISEQKEKIEEESIGCLIDIHKNLKNKLKEKNIKNEIQFNSKNIYEIYKKLKDGKITDVHDLLSFKVIVDNVDNCYLSLGAIHSVYHPLADSFKDYISSPKSNMYQSLHTTFFTPDERLVQARIRTHDMDNIAMYGLTAYWDINKGEARIKMQQDLQKNGHIIDPLIEISKMSKDNKEFVDSVKGELFSEKIYVYTSKGNVVELPLGSTAIDLAYELGDKIGNTMVAVEVNGNYVMPETKLKTNDIVKIETNDASYGPKEEWLDVVKTTGAKRKIKEFRKRK